MPLFNPSVLILDEPTNELDSVTEKIIELLVKLKSKITIILISHKDSSFKLCDKIYKIEIRNIDMIKKKLRIFLFHKLFFDIL